MSNTNTNNLRAITIYGPDSVSKDNDLLGLMSNSFIGPPRPGKQKPIGSGCTLVSSASAGNSDGWNLDLLIEDNGGFDQLLTRLKEMEANSVCRVAESPVATECSITGSTGSTQATHDDTGDIWG